MTTDRRQAIDIDADDYVEREKRRQKKRIVIGLVSVAAVLGISGAAFALYPSDTPAGDPVRVLVVAHGGVDRAVDGPLLRGFERRLTEHGFDVVRDDTVIPPGETEPAIAEVRRRALAENAGTSVVLEIRAVAEREGVAPGNQLFRSSLTVRVVPTDPADPVSQSQVEFAYEQPSAMLAIASVTNAWLDTLGPESIDLLYRTVAVSRAVGGERLPMERMRFQVKLANKRVMVETRRTRVEAWNAYQDREREAARHSTDAEEGVRCIGDPSRPWSVIGVTGDGSAAIVHEAYRTPIFGMLIEHAVSWTEPPEGILVVPFDGSEPRPVLRVGHFYGLATTSADGRWATASFFASQVPAVVTIGLDEGDVGVRWLLEPRERSGQRETTPDGRAIFTALEREGWTVYDGENAVSLPEFREARLVSNADGESRIVGQLQDRRLAVHTLDGAEDGAPVELSGSVLDVLGLRDGAVQLLVSGDDGCALASIDRASRRVTETALPLCLGDAAMLPDGRLAGITRRGAQGDAPGDTEVALVDPASGAVNVLTRGTFDDELVHVSADGRSIVFARRMEDWPDEYDVELYRRIVCRADVPPR